MKALFVAIWSFRHFIVSSIRVDFRSRFVRSRLGGLWMIVNPLASSAIYAIVFSGLMSMKLPTDSGRGSYAIYLLSGMLAWAFFAEVVARSTTLFIDNANLLKKVRFPRICLSVILIGSCLLNNVLLLLASLVIFFFLGHVPGFLALWILPLMLVNTLLAASLGLLVGIFNVFVRDVSQVVPVVMQLLFWLTPVVYVIQVVPAGLHSLIFWNPMYWIVTSYQDVLLFNTPPPMAQIGVIALLALLLSVLSLLVFRRAGPEMVDVL